MPFSSITFIFLFLPITLILFYVLPKRAWQNTLLVILSFAFFAWSDPTHIHVLLLSILLNYFIGRKIGKVYSAKEEKSAKSLMWTGVILNLLLLGLYKYTGFFFDIIESVFSISINYSEPALPVSYTHLDVYKRQQQLSKKLV